MSKPSHYPPFTFLQFIREFGAIRIPMIQRDYAQGRASWEGKRSRFLERFRRALLPKNDPDFQALPLDFIYGTVQSEDGIEAFCPLDGQQRLTTLFLLHWYLALHDGALETFRKEFCTEFGTACFTYHVRPGGRAFFQALVNWDPPQIVGFPNRINSIALSALIRNTAWFRPTWEADPTVVGGLTMIDSLHACFKEADNSTYERLADVDRIHFRVIPLEDTGLHDDLYLRMNARGKNLTNFETFKARFGKYLEERFPDAKLLKRCTVKTKRQFSEAIDGIWLDVFWDWARHLDIETEEQDKTVDFALMNIFRAVALISLSNNTAKAEAVTTLTETDADFDDFEKNEWLSENLTSRLIHLLEAWTSKAKGGRVTPLFNLNPWLDEDAMLTKVTIAHSEKASLTDYLQFAAYVRFIELNGSELNSEQTAAFQEWMRVVRNLAVNTIISNDRFSAFLRALDRLVAHSGDILGYLANPANPVPAFNEQQVAEERVKASLFIADERWRKPIHSAENHGYFVGQIDFLLDFSGLTEFHKSEPIVDWTPEMHSVHLEQFEFYLTQAKSMFDARGLIVEPDFLWQRALLAIGDYPLYFGGARWSFLTNTRSSHVSWKRLLRQEKTDSTDKRAFIKILWDRLERESLTQISSDTAALPAWRKVICRNPEVMNYCGQQLFEFSERAAPREPKICLMSRQRRSAAYAELFTFHLCKTEQLNDKPQRFAPLEFKEMKTNCGSQDEPHLNFNFALDCKITPIIFRLYSQNGDDDGFSLWLVDKDLDPALREHLRAAGFEETSVNENSWLVRRQAPADLLGGAAFLQSCAEVLETFNISPNLR